MAQWLYLGWCYWWVRGPCGMLHALVQPAVPAALVGCPAVGQQATHRPAATLPSLPYCQVGELLRTLCQQQGIAVWEQVRWAGLCRRFFNIDNPC